MPEYIFDQVLDPGEASCLALAMNSSEIRPLLSIWLSGLPRSAAEAGKKVKKTKSGLPVSGRKTKKATGRR
jgi:hypothetical protein